MDDTNTNKLGTVSIKLNATIKVNLDKWNAEYGEDQTRYDTICDVHSYFRNALEVLPEHLADFVTITVIPHV